MEGGEWTGGRRGGEGMRTAQKAPPPQYLMPVPVRPVVEPTRQGEGQEMEDK